ncbi:MAG: hypothetical protein U9P07_06690 [Pseudomonadota bacterium]|nr:hypothetical protein [Pseudomonadota bacterium]
MPTNPGKLNPIFRGHIVNYIYRESSTAHNLYSVGVKINHDDGY